MNDTSPGGALRAPNVPKPRRAVAAAAAFGLALLLAGCAGNPASAPAARSAAPDPADCPGDVAVGRQLEAYLARQPIPNPPDTLSAAGAECSARKLVAALGATQGRVVGYKAGLTTAAMQQRFGVDRPLVGTLLERMLVRDGASVPAKFGTVPFVESDLLVEVGSAAINDATTPAQALASLRAVIPFIELPDRLFENPNQLTAAALIAGNVGARMGVVGTPVPVRADPAFAEALRTMTVRLYDGSGREVASGRGSDILGDPMNAVLVIVQDVKRRGMALKPGDLLSLGGYGVGQAAPGGGARAVYEGLPGTPSVSVRFQ